VNLDDALKEAELDEIVEIRRAPDYSDKITTLRRLILDPDSPAGHFAFALDYLGWQIGHFGRVIAWVEQRKTDPIISSPHREWMEFCDHVIAGFIEGCGEMVAQRRRIEAMATLYHGNAWQEPGLAERALAELFPEAD
jgi:hypothetical protein